MVALLSRDRRRGRVAATFAFALLVALSLSVLPASSKTLGAKSNQLTSLNVGTTLELPPMQYLGTNGKPTGFEYEMVNAVLAKLGYKMNIVKTPFPQAFVGLLSKKYNMFFSAVYVTCSRIAGAQGAIGFTVPVYTAPHAIAAKANVAQRLHSFNDLKGMSVGFESKGGTADLLSDAFLKKHPGYFKKTVFANVSDLILALEEGRVNAAVADQITLLWGIKGHYSDLGVSRTPLPETDFPVGWVFRKGDPMIGRFNTAIHQLQRNGTFGKIWKKWFGTAPGSGNAAVHPLPTITKHTCIKGS